MTSPHDDPYLVFAQAEDEALPLERLSAAAARFFDAKLASERDGFTLTIPSRNASAHFAVAVRPTTPGDFEVARAAEERGRAGGMSTLAARCHFVWLLRPEPGAEPWLVLECAAVLASVALGPVLPPDGSTLLGIRSARERAEKLRRSTE